MIEAAHRARIRELMASGALPNDPPVIQRSGQLPAGRGRDACVICTEPDPTVNYFWTGGLVVRVHAACDALWQQERP